MSWIATITESLATLSTITGSLFFTTLVTVPTPIPGVDEQPRYYWYQDPCGLTPNGDSVVLSSGGSGMGCWIQMYPYQVQPDWNATAGSAFIRNKPILFNGSYLSLSNVPSTFAPSAHTHAYSSLTGLPSLATVATSGSYTDLTNRPSIPSVSPFSFGYPVARTLSVSTSYQATDNTKAALLSLSLACANNSTVLAANPCTIQIRINNGTATCSNGTVWSTISASVDLGLVITQRNTTNVVLPLPAGGYFIACPTAGTWTIPNAAEASAS